MPREPSHATFWLACPYICGNPNRFHGYTIWSGKQNNGPFGSMTFASESASIPFSMGKEKSERIISGWSVSDCSITSKPLTASPHP
jgi:hypothetical protein